LNFAAWKLKIKDDICFEGIKFANPEVPFSRKTFFPPFTANFSDQIYSILNDKEIPPLNSLQKEEISLSKNFFATYFNVNLSNFP